MMTKEIIFQTMNEWAAKKIPFFFIISYDKTEGEVLPLHQLAKEEVFFKTPNYNNIPATVPDNGNLEWSARPISKEKYKAQFDKVMLEIRKGNTYLVNLTCAASIKTNLSLLSIFQRSSSKYKLFYKDQFIHFSPEPFVRI